MYFGARLVPGGGVRGGYNDQMNCYDWLKCFQFHLIGIHFNQSYISVTDTALLKLFKVTTTSRRSISKTFEWNLSAKTGLRNKKVKKNQKNQATCTSKRWQRQQWARRDRRELRPQDRAVHASRLANVKILYNIILQYIVHSCIIPVIVF